MHSLNFEHVQKILRTKRLQRQAKTGNNVIKRRPGRPRKQPLEESEPTNKREEAHVEGLSLDMLASKRGDGRTLGMPVLERCDDLSGLQTLRPNLARESLDLSNHDSISATIEKVVHQARSVTPLAKGGKRRGRGHSMDELWAPSSQQSQESSSAVNKTSAAAGLQDAVPLIVTHLSTLDLFLLSDVLERLQWLSWS